MKKSDSEEAAMRVYIVTYRYMADRDKGIYTGERISQEGYRSLEEAQRYIMSRNDHPVKVTEMYFVADNTGEYYIHDVLIRQSKVGELK